jgi:hypothetical protein
MAAAGAPGATPQRFAPTLTSTSTEMVAPAARAAAPISRTTSASSASTATLAIFAIAASRASFACADDLVGDEHVAHAGRDEGLGLGHLLAADTDGAALELGESDVRALVRLAVGAQRHRGAAHCVRHQVEIALEHVEIDDERRCVDVAGGVAGACWRGLHCESSTSRPTAVARLRPLRAGRRRHARS